MKAKRPRSFYVHSLSAYNNMLLKTKPTCRWDITGKKIRMKKIILIMALIAGVVVGAMTLSAFNKPTKVESYIEKTDSPVWKGWAYRNGAYGKYEKVFRGGSTNSNIWIKVYPSDNSCGSYYAITEGNDTHYIVKSNPDYNYKSQDSENVEYYSHYINYGGAEYFFRM